MEMVRETVYNLSDNIYLRLYKALKDIGCKLCLQCLKYCCDKPLDTILDSVVIPGNFYPDEIENARLREYEKFDILFMYKLLENNLYYTGKRGRECNGRSLLDMLKVIRDERNSLAHKVEKYSYREFETRMKTLETVYREASYEMKNVCSDILHAGNLNTVENNVKQNGLDEILELNENIQQIMNSIKQDRIEIVSDDLENYCSESSEDLYMFFSIPTLQKSGII